MIETELEKTDWYNFWYESEIICDKEEKGKEDDGHTDGREDREDSSS